MFYKKRIVVIFWIIVSVVGMKVLAQSASGDPVSYTMEVPKVIKIGNQFTISAVFNIEPGWYVYAPIRMNTTRGKIATKVTFKVPEGIKKNRGIRITRSK